MFYAGYDTDDLTDRQNYIFHKLNHNSSNGITMLALNFLRHCIRKNFSLKQFNDYDGDCDYLFDVKQEILDRCGINLNTLYD